LEEEINRRSADYEARIEEMKIQLEEYLDKIESSNKSGDEKDIEISRIRRDNEEL
jgi:hypothetical protein